MPKKLQHTQALSRVESFIVTVRGHKIILDKDLAAIYGVTTARLNQQVRRNIDRFPEDFMFPLKKDEYNALMLQNATSRAGHGGRRKTPLAFTEHGAIMAANVLKTTRAVQMSVFVVRAFVRLREAVVAHSQLAHKLVQLEQIVGKHDAAITAIITAIRKLMAPPKSRKRRIGFEVKI